MVDKNHNIEITPRAEFSARAETISNSVGLISSIVYSAFGYSSEQSSANQVEASGNVNTYYSPTPEHSGLTNSQSVNASNQEGSSSGDQEIDANPVSPHVAYVTELIKKANQERGRINEEV